MKKYTPLPYQKSEFLQQMMSRMMIIVRGMPQCDHELSAENLKDCVNRYFGMAAKEKLFKIIEDYKKYHASVYADVVLDMPHISSHDLVKDQIDFAAIDWIMNTMNVFVITAYDIMEEMHDLCENEGKFVIEHQDLMEMEDLIDQLRRIDTIILTEIIPHTHGEWFINVDCENWVKDGYKFTQFEAIMHRLSIAAAHLYALKSMDTYGKAEFNEMNGEITAELYGE